MRLSELILELDKLQKWLPDDPEVQLRGTNNDTVEVKSLSAFRTLRDSKVVLH